MWALGLPKRTSRVALDVTGVGVGEDVVDAFGVSVAMVVGLLLALLLGLALVLGLALAVAVALGSTVGLAITEGLGEGVTLATSFFSLEK